MTQEISHPEDIAISRGNRIYYTFGKILQAAGLWIVSLYAFVSFRKLSWGTPQENALTLLILCTGGVAFLLLNEGVATWRSIKEGEAE